MQNSAKHKTVDRTNMSFSLFLCPQAAVLFVSLRWEWKEEMPARDIDIGFLAVWHCQMATAG
jgi:hypothetical protein